jgi:hypothetical protein
VNLFLVPIFPEGLREDSCSLFGVLGDSMTLQHLNSWGHGLLRASRAPTDPRPWRSAGHPPRERFLDFFPFPQAVLCYVLFYHQVAPPQPQSCFCSQEPPDFVSQ